MCGLSDPRQSKLAVLEKSLKVFTAIQTSWWLVCTWYHAARTWSPITSGSKTSRCLTHYMWIFLTDHEAIHFMDEDSEQLHLVARCWRCRKRCCWKSGHSMMAPNLVSCHPLSYRLTAEMLERAKVFPFRYPCGKFSGPFWIVDVPSIELVPPKIASLSSGRFGNISMKCSDVLNSDISIWKLCKNTFSWVKTHCDCHFSYTIQYIYMIYFTKKRWTAQPLLYWTCRLNKSQP